jgi:integration host factor subunit alpha
MTKSDIIDAVHAGGSGLSKREASEIVELVFETIKQMLARGETVKLSGFGSFLVRDKKERQGRNPQTGEPIRIAARRVVTYKVSAALKEKLN